jgi:hypothetical protein
VIPFLQESSQERGPETRLFGPLKKFT